MFKTVFHRAAVAFHGFFVPSEDNLSATFSKVQGSLKRVMDRAEAALAAERHLRSASIDREEAAKAREIAARAASYDRSEKAFGTLERAARVSDRIEQLFA